MGPSSPIVVGILYPPAWYGSEQAFASEVAALEAVDPRVEVLVATYEEPHGLRTARGTGDDARFRPRAIARETMAALKRVQVVLANRPPCRHPLGRSRARPVSDWLRRACSCCPIRSVGRMKPSCTSGPTPPPTG